MTDERSGIDDRGNWTPAFEGQRPPFEQGHELSVRHGAYSSLRLAGRADEIVDELRELVGGRYRPSDEPMIRLLATTWARVEAASAAAEEAGDPVALSRLEQDLRGWIRIARQLLSDLGMSPTSRARMGLDVAQTARALNVTDLAAAAVELDDVVPVDVDAGEGA